MCVRARGTKVEGNEDDIDDDEDGDGECGRIY